MELESTIEGETKTRITEQGHDDSLARLTKGGLEKAKKLNQSTTQASMGMLFHLQGRLFARQALFKSLVNSSLLQLMVLKNLSIKV